MAEKTNQITFEGRKYQFNLMRFGAETRKSTC